MTLPTPVVLLNQMSIQTNVALMFDGTGASALRMVGWLGSYGIKAGFGFSGMTSYVRVLHRDGRHLRCQSHEWVVVDESNTPSIHRNDSIKHNYLRAT